MELGIWRINYQRRPDFVLALNQRISQQNQQERSYCLCGHTAIVLCIFVGAGIFVAAVLDWQGPVAAWAAGGFSAMLLGLSLLVTTSVDGVLHAVERLRETAERRR